MTVTLKLISKLGTEQFVALGPTEAKEKLQKNVEVNYDKILYSVKKVTTLGGNTIIECTQKQEL